MGWMSDFAQMFSAVDNAKVQQQMYQLAQQNSQLDQSKFDYDRKVTERNYERSLFTDDRNYKDMIENRDYMRAMQREAWNREDTATQRKVKDLEAAGLSKTLAAGSGAQSSAPIQVGTPQRKIIEQGLAPNRSTKGAEMMEGALQMRASNMQNIAAYMQQRENIAVTEAQKELIKLQQKKTEAETEDIKARTLGSEIENAFAPRRQAAELESSLLDTAFKRLSMPDRMVLFKKEVEGKDIDNLNKRITSDLLSAGVAEKQIDVVKENLKLKAQQDAGMSEAELDLYSKSVALELQKLRLKEDSYNYETWRKYGLPTSSGLDASTRSGMILHNALRQLFPKVFGGF